MLGPVHARRKTFLEKKFPKKPLHFFKNLIEFSIKFKYIVIGDTELCSAEDPSRGGGTPLRPFARFFQKRFV